MAQQVPFNHIRLEMGAALQNLKDAQLIAAHGEAQVCDVVMLLICTRVVFVCAGLCSWLVLFFNYGSSSSGV